MSRGETLSYREMIEQILDLPGKPVRFLNVSPWMFRSATNVMALISDKQGTTLEMATLMKLTCVLTTRRQQGIFVSRHGWLGLVDTMCKDERWMLPV